LAEDFQAAAEPAAAGKLQSKEDKKMSKTGGIILGVVAALLGALLLMALYVVGIYNNLVRQDEGVRAAWAQVENQLQRRNDLIPNLVETVKGFARQEKGIFENVANARAKLAGAQQIGDKINAANEVSGFLGRLLAIVENYPQLKSDANFRQLQDELAGTENRIAVERMRYNETVKVFNQTIRTFPRNMLAGMFGIEKAKLFDAPQSAEAVPQVNFSQPAPETK
jgi:LemA protein